VKAYIFACLLFVLCGNATAVPGDVEELGFIKRVSVSDILSQLGEKSMTCIDGKTIEDLKGYKIVANCSRRGTQYLVILWVSLDWGRGRIISITPRN
jgi:hypothetical protein